MTNKEAIFVLKKELDGIPSDLDKSAFEKAVGLAIKALHTVEIIKEELGPEYEENAIWFDVPHFEEIQERADIRVKNELN